MSQNQRKFRNILVNPDFQPKFILLMAGFGFIVLVTNYFLLDSFVENKYLSALKMADIPDDLKVGLTNDTEIMRRSLLWYGVIFEFVVIGIGLFFSHKVAGPLYHFKRVFSQVADGDKQARVNLRPGDEFEDVAKEFNRMMDNLTK